MISVNLPGTRCEGRRHGKCAQNVGLQRPRERNCHHAQGGRGAGVRRGWTGVPVGAVEVAWGEGITLHAAHHTRGFPRCTPRLSLHDQVAPTPRGVRRNALPECVVLTGRGEVACSAGRLLGILLGRHWTAPLLGGPGGPRLRCHRRPQLLRHGVLGGHGLRLAALRQAHGPPASLGLGRHRCRSGRLRRELDLLLGAGLPSRLRAARRRQRRQERIRRTRAPTASGRRF